jgi:hypothetical protein
MNIGAVVGFDAYIKEMQVQETKSPVKNLVRQCCAEGFNSGVKGLIRTGCLPHTYVNVCWYC